MDLEGQTLDIYRIYEPLGAGMTATVYRAMIEGTRRDVAVKVLQPEVRADDTFLKRFHREGAICAQINHPNLLRVYQVSDANAEIQYIVTDLIVGVNLSQFLVANPIVVPELAVLLTLPVLKGLAALHERGVIHRDIKPDNIMVDWSKRRVVITDLGLAQPVDGSRLSVVGQIVGSVAFMAPERIRDAPFDHRVDIWSVGTILYYLSTGAFPFDAETRDEFVRRVLKAQVKPPREVNPAIAPAVERAILGCLQGDPQERYDAAQKVRDDLERHLRDLGFDEPESLLVDYLSNPKGFAETFRTRVGEAMTALASRSTVDRAAELESRLPHYLPKPSSAPRALPLGSECSPTPTSGARRAPSPANPEAGSSPRLVPPTPQPGPPSPTTDARAHAGDLPIRAATPSNREKENRALVLGILVGALIGLSTATALFMFYWYLLR